MVIINWYFTEDSDTLKTLNRWDNFGDASRSINSFDNFSDTGRAINTAGNASFATRYGDDVAQSISPSCINSFKANTEVATDEGDTLRAISQIQIGDYVLAWDEETNLISFYPVTDTIESLQSPAVNSPVLPISRQLPITIHQ